MRVLCEPHIWHVDCFSLRHTMPVRFALAVLVCASFLASPVGAQDPNSCAYIDKQLAYINGELRNEPMMLNAQEKAAWRQKLLQARSAYQARRATCGQTPGAGGAAGAPGAQSGDVGQSVGDAAKNIGDAIGRQGDEAIRALENLGKGPLAPRYRGLDTTLRDKVRFGRSDVNLDDLESGAGGSSAGPRASGTNNAAGPAAHNVAPGLPPECAVLQKKKTGTRDLLALCGPGGDSARCAAAQAQLDADRKRLLECVQKIQIPGATPGVGAPPQTTTSARCEGPNAKNLANRYICVGENGSCGGTLPCCTDECQDNNGAPFNLHDDKSLYLACHPKTRRCVRASQLGVPAYAAPEMPNPSLVTFDLPKPQQNKPSQNAALDELDAVLNKPATPSAAAAKAQHAITFRWTVNGKHFDRNCPSDVKVEIESLSGPSPGALNATAYCGTGMARIGDLLEGTYRFRARLDGGPWQEVTVQVQNEAGTTLDFAWSRKTAASTSDVRPAVVPNRGACAVKDLLSLCAEVMPGLQAVDPGLPSRAKCRGACGVDCPSHCKPSKRTTCLSARDGCGQTMNVRCTYEVLSCGSHPACVIHDGEYDDCARAAQQQGMDGAALARKCVSPLRHPIAVASDECRCWREADEKCRVGNNIKLCLQWALDSTLLPGPMPDTIEFSKRRLSAEVETGACQ